MVSFSSWLRRLRSNLQETDMLESPCGGTQRYATTGIAGCCARVASGHDAAPTPSRVMNSRRFMANMACGGVLAGCGFKPERLPEIEVKLQGLATFYFDRREALRNRAAKAEQSS
jgi:hypothetical protein